METQQERNKQEKWQRLSQALRANLRKRKQQQRERENTMIAVLDKNASHTIPLTLTLSQREREYSELPLSPEEGEGWVRGLTQTKED